jgi:hypothetical protein
MFRGNGATGRCDAILPCPDAFRTSDALLVDKLPAGGGRFRLCPCRTIHSEPLATGVNVHGSFLPNRHPRTVVPSAGQLKLTTELFRGKRRRCSPAVLPSRAPGLPSE